MKFQAEKPDLTLELITLSGEEVNFEPAVPVSAREAVRITNKWKEIEQKQKKTKSSAIELLATELAFIYPKSKEWFLDNFDFGVLNEILIYVAQTIGGIKKNITESKELQN